MPTKHQRIPVTKDAELAEALAQVESQFRGRPTASVVHDLAVKGAEAFAREDVERREALERLIELFSGSADGIDLDVLERVEELAW